MATYAGSTQASPRFGSTIWLAVVAFAVAAALVVVFALVQGGSSGPDRVGTRQTVSHSVLMPAANNVGDHTIPLGNGICHQCKG